MRERWPKQQRLIRQLRDVLQREFGCQDAYVVQTGGHCRLEVRVQGRHLTLLEDTEEQFWARFYVPVERERVHLGERVVHVQQWRKPPADLVVLLTPYWLRCVGTPPRASLPRRSGYTPPPAQR